MKYTFFLLPTVMVSFFFYMIFIEADKLNNNTLYKKYIVKPDCEYVLPNQYFLVRNDLTKEYAVKFMHIDYYTYYLYLRRYSLIRNRLSNMGDDFEAITFKDSCQAKGYAKMFFDQEDIKINKYSFH